jgi:large subunit ribosomal protein L20
MPRVHSVVTRLKRRKRLLERVKGFRGSLHKKKRQARAFAIRAGRYAYVDRRLKKRDFRKLWITRISGALTDRGLSYSQFMHGLKKAQITLDRKVLAALAIEAPAQFDEIVGKAKAALAA